MRILVVSAMFPPHILGGAEISASNLASWLLKQGHEIGVLTAAPSPDEEKSGEMVDGMKVWARFFPRPYPIHKQGNVKQTYLKPLWHLQDHIDPRNPRILGEVLDAFKPDFCNVHYMTGIGHNALAEIGKRDIPMMYVMHDMGLSCVRMTMFSKGKTCETQCTVCKVSAWSKRKGITAARRIGFASPSRANLELNARHQPLNDYPTAAIPNANKYPPPTIARQPSDVVRFVYAGRLEESKGVDVLLTAAEAARKDWNFTFKVVGKGSAEADLKARYGHHDWIEFTGHVPMQEAIDHIAGSDVLCIPSLWFEVLGGVVVQALQNSVPVIASKIGGIPEFVEHDYNGLLVQPGDVDAWRRALETLLSQPEKLAHLRSNAAARASEYDPDYLGSRFLAFMEKIRDSGPVGKRA
ncbi:glycosyltransferase [Rhizobium sp. Leaf371]|uniref:glycosyltransferase n=1 Tax=Rhizobium sp. Leaf371 TaxID=1736355 RepID=UPI0009E9DEE2|nr:glycosyltransferase [Rhizobium sp. Leaf371]